MIVCDVCTKQCTRARPPGNDIGHHGYDSVELVWWELGDKTIYLCYTCWSAALNTVGKLDSRAPGEWLAAGERIARSMAKLAQEARGTV